MRGSKAGCQGREAARRGARTLDSLPYGLNAGKKEGTAILGRTLLFAHKHRKSARACARAFDVLS